MSNGDVPISQYKDFIDSYKLCNILDFGIFFNLTLSISNTEYDQEENILQLLGVIVSQFVFLESSDGKIVRSQLFEDNNSTKDISARISCITSFSSTHSGFIGILISFHSLFCKS
jgi:hypothetical protein